MKTKRVGMITMGVSLVLAGALLIYHVFQPNLDILLILKLTPIILVFLGLEILYYSFTYKEEKLKYDFLSMFVCFILIVGSLAMAAVPQVVEYYTHWEQENYRVIIED